MVATAGVGVAGDRGAAGSAQQFVHRHPSLLPLDVPQGHVDAAQRGVEDGAAAPVAAIVHALPDVFDAAGLAANQQRSQALFEGRGDSGGVIVLAGRADAVEAGLVGDDFDDDPSAVLAVRMQRTSLILAMSVSCVGLRIAEFKEGIICKLIFGCLVGVHAADSCTHL